MAELTPCKLVLVLIVCTNAIYDANGAVWFDVFELTVQRPDKVYNSTALINDNGEPTLRLTTENIVDESYRVRFNCSLDDVPVVEHDGTICDTIEDKVNVLSEGIHEASVKCNTPLAEYCPLSAGEVCLQDILLGEVPGISSGKLTGIMEVYDPDGVYFTLHFEAVVKPSNPSLE